MEQWFIDHAPEGLVTAVLALLAYFVKRRDAKIDEIERKMHQMPFVYAMKDDVKEIKDDVKQIKNYLMEKD